jgi:hypothetical protein
MWMMRAVTDGLPISTLQRVARRIAPDDKALVYRLLPRPTFGATQQGIQREMDL